MKKILKIFKKKKKSKPPEKTQETQKNKPQKERYRSNKNPKPFPREWTSIISPLNEQEEEKGEEKKQHQQQQLNIPNSFSIVTQNVLSQRYMQPHFYKYLKEDEVDKKKILSNEYRMDLLLKRIEEMKCDVFCFQELDERNFVFLKDRIGEEYGCAYKRITKCNSWEENSEKKDKSIYEIAMDERKDGSGIFYKKDTFELVNDGEKDNNELSPVIEMQFNDEAWKEFQNLQKNLETEDEKKKLRKNFLDVVCLESHNVAITVVLIHKESGEKVIISTHHADFQFKKPYSQIWQKETYFNHLEQIQKKFKVNNLFVLGDFNMPLGKEVHAFVVGKKLEEQQSDINQMYKALNRIPSHNLNLIETYKKEEKPYTQFSQKSGKEHYNSIDYVFYSEGKLKPYEILKIPKKEEYGKFPNEDEFSDHIMIGAKFYFKKC